MDLWLETILAEEEIDERIKSYMNEKHLQEQSDED